MKMDLKYLAEIMNVFSHSLESPVRWGSFAEAGLLTHMPSKEPPKIPDMFEEKLISYLFLMQESDLIRAHKQTLLSFNKLNEGYTDQDIINMTQRLFF